MKKADFYHMIDRSQRLIWCRSVIKEIHDTAHLMINIDSSNNCSHHSTTVQLNLIKLRDRESHTNTFSHIVPFRREVQSAVTKLFNTRQPKLFSLLKRDLRHLMEI